MKAKSVTLQDIVITWELLDRTGRPENPEAEKVALEEIAKATPLGQDAILRALCRTGLRMCHAGSSGINLLEESDGERLFRWTVVEGMLAPSEGGTAPASHSPCGYVYERKSAQLLSNSARYFEWMQSVDIPVFESLIVPLHRNRDEIIGTIWVVSHEEHRHFDREDLRVMTLLGSHAMAALRVHEEMYQPG